MPTRRKLPPLNALKAFEAAARLGGFTAAGEELFVSPGAVSRHVVNLESFLGVPLFQRRHNEVNLTSEGAVYLGKIRIAMDAIEDASESVVAESLPQNLHINALPTFAERWLMPSLQNFTELHPRAQIQVSTSLEETDWDTDRADVSIYASIGEWIERGERLFSTVISPVCSPEWLARHGRPQAAADLLGHTLISSAYKTGDWLRWFHAAGLQPEAALPQHVFGASTLAYKAAIEGVGIVCAELAFVAQDLAAGRLVSLSDISAAGSSYFVEIRPDKKESPLSRAFRAWIVAQATTRAA